MQYLLLIIILGFLILIINKIGSNHNSLQNNIYDLSKKLESLKKDISNVTVKEKTIIKPDEQESIIQTPVEEAAASLDDIEQVTQDIKEDTIAIADTTTAPIFENSISSDDKENVPTQEEVLTSPIEKEKIAKKSVWQNFKEKNPDLEKFIGENLINKLGILILVLGVSYFVKYAIDKDWINEPARVGIGILTGSLVMAIAHRLRKNYSAFSSVLVAGAIAIFYFTIAIAFHEYQLFNQTIAFVIMVVITIFSLLVSLSYNRMELAILSLIGGFAVPFMISTGSGNHIVLFTYFIILNIGILALAYYKKWSLVNVLAFVFTIILYGGWFFIDVTSNKPHYLDALIFAFAFYLIFTLTNIINNLRTQGAFSKIQLSILAINTFLFYGVGMVVLTNYHSELKGLFTAALALLNLMYASVLYKKFKLDKKAVYMLIGLTLTFITLAIPIQFEGNYITLFWAAEAALLMWLAQKSNINSYRFASIIVHGLMIFSLILDWQQKYTSDDILNIIANPIFGTGIFAVASLFLTYYLLKNETEKISQWKLNFNPITYRKYLFTIGLIIAYLVGFIETLYQATHYIDNIYVALSIPALYHLLFTAIIAFKLYKKGTIPSHQLLNVIAIGNIILFVIYISRLAFIEHQEYIASGFHQRTAFYLHYISLLLVVYFGYLIYRTNKVVAVFEAFQKNIVVWIAAFFIICISSIEVSLHGLVLLNSPITMQEIQSHEYYNIYQDNIDGLRHLISSETISTTTSRIIKTSYPVLWGILAFVFLIIGIKKQLKTVRIIALVLLGITIAKLFLFDISNASETGKIISFILLGVLILTISFVYQKIKVLVIDETKTDLDDETD